MMAKRLRIVNQVALLGLLVFLQCICGQNEDVGNARPCGQDNLSCPNEENPNSLNDCYNRDQLCDGFFLCSDGSDEGQNFSVAGLNCDSVLGAQVGLFTCESGETVALDALCDGFANCTSGTDETTPLCENKCLLPYYGGCSHTRDCISTEFGVECGECLNEAGYTENPANPGGDCIRPASLYPFGDSEGDSRVPRVDDGSSPAVTLDPPLTFFGTAEGTLYVNTNGVLSFRSSFIDFSPDPFPRVGPLLIAPFWDDVNILTSGTIYYRQTTNSTLLEQFRDELIRVSSMETFFPTLLFISTWDRVAAFGGSRDVLNTFQVVIATDGQSSFVTFLYGDIQWGRAQIGFNAGDGVHAVSLPGSLSTTVIDIETMSNVDPQQPGLYMFRVDPPIVLVPNGIRFDREMYTVEESESFVEVCAVLSETLQFIVTLSTTEDTASRDEDYRAITRDFNLNGMECVQIPIFNDNTVEGPERFSVNLTAAGFTIDSAIVEIADDNTIEIRFLQTVYIVNELSGTVMVCATTNVPLQESMTLLWQTENGTATEGADYDPVIITDFNNDMFCATIQVKDDSIDEITEAFFINAQVLGFNDSASALISIIDDDIPTFSFSQSIYTFGESVGNATVCAMTGTELERTITLNIRTSDKTATGGSDYTGISRDLTFDADHNTSCTDIPILPDQLHENNESFSVILSGPTSILTAAVLVCEDSDGTNETATFATACVILLDDDTVGIGFEQPVYIVRETQGSFTMSVMLNITLDETRVDARAESSDVTARAQSDYSIRTPGLAFNSGERQKGLEIQIKSSLQEEKAESFLITLMSNDTHSVCPTATVVILDTYSLYPHGNGEDDSTVLVNEDNCSSQFLLQQNFTFYGENEREVYVNTNGIISFQLPFNESKPRQFPFESTPLIAPFWNDDIMRNLSRRLYYRETNDSTLLHRAHENVQQAFPHIWNFFPTTLFIATWVEEEPTDGERITDNEESFQVVMATDEEHSFVIFIHGNMQWDSNNTTVGFNAGDGMRHFQIKQSRGPSPGNFDIPGVYIFRVDQADVIIGPNNGCTTGEVLLVEGATQGEGVVEVCSGNQWERQCVDESWNDTSASDVCRQLGFLGGVAVRCTTIDSMFECMGFGEDMNVTGSASGSATSGDVSSGILHPDDNSYIGVRCTVASVGLGEASYTVREEVGFLNVCVGLSQPLERSLTVTLQTVESGTAEALSDFNATSTVLTFGPAAAEQQECVEIAISDDDTVESNESFLVLLTTVEQAVSLNRQHTFVTIIDDDEIVSIGLPTSVSGSFTATPGSFATTLGSLAITSPEPSTPISTPGTTVTPTSGAGTSQDITTPLATSLTLGTVAVIILVLAVTLLMCLHKRRRKPLTISQPQRVPTQPGDISMSFLNRAQLDMGVTNPYALFQQEVMSKLEDSGSLKELSFQMVIPCKNIRLLDSIGQGEFGIVYKAHLVSGGRRNSKCSSSVIEFVAVKTLKGFYDQSQVSEMLRESLKMVEFDHPNVLNLIGVCLDGGPAPYIVLPFMANGSLHSYLKKERQNLLLGEEADIEEVSTLTKRLLDMCIQIAKGMEYLASRNFVHRDLAARNCMIDTNFVIKVADFGLSENTYTKTYFRQGQDTAVKLPIKWLSLESLNDGVFSEKTDVWAFGVTCWEVFSAGKTPYPGVAPMSLPGLLENGHRLEKPSNTACGDEMYSIMLSCWNAIPEERPPFSELVNKISGILEPLADYMDFSSFGRTQSIRSKVVGYTAAAATAEFECTTTVLPTISEDFEPPVIMDNRNTEHYV